MSGASAIQPAVWAMLSGVLPLRLVGLVYSLGTLAYSTRRPNPWPCVFGYLEVIHLVVATFAFLMGATGAALISARLRADARLRAIAALATALSVLSIVALLATLFLSGPTNHFGLFERLFIGLILLWQVVVTARALRIAGR